MTFLTNIHRLIFTGISRNKGKEEGKRIKRGGKEVGRERGKGTGREGKRVGGALSTSDQDPCKRRKASRSMYPSHCFMYVNVTRKSKLTSKPSYPATHTIHVSSGASARILERMIRYSIRLTPSANFFKFSQSALPLHIPANTPSGRLINTRGESNSRI